MDDQMKELIAIGASAAVNCHPCLQHHLAECGRLGIDRADVKAAVDVGMMVNRGAAAKTRDVVQSLLGPDVGQKGGERGCCGT
ncbi:carboxymuconolactone decarboxylase family protein [Telmatospirillum sp.]|uniref:carboxymuconolactone decarboxylase family protein n=1 Tax=Telmatospirillum sp. TaxID=2079197 RepID=UPI00284B9181|nr:carboxymuconolactone decarboxylase family protein [Telmatospirillum sp.]MDR3438410.1 carboxymuconolactone decarboxylase family protein [Telmatospirillum sp.]